MDHDSGPAVDSQPSGPSAQTAPPAAVVPGAQEEVSPAVASTDPAPTAEAIPEMPADEQPDVMAGLTQIDRMNVAQPPRVADPVEPDPAAAYGFGPPPMSPAALAGLSVQVGDDFGMGPPTDGLSAAVPKISKAPKSLEDLYIAHPDVGNGTSYTRVYRKKPKMHLNMPISGFLDDIPHTLTLQEMAKRFGGGTYEVHVMGPSPTVLDADGAPRVKSLDYVEIELPGMPKATGSGEEEDKMGWRSSMPQGYQDTQVRVKELDIHAKERERWEQERARMASESLRRANIDPHVLELVTGVSERRADEVRAANSEQLKDLRVQVQRKDELLEKKDGEIQRLREEIVKIQRDAAETYRRDESAEVKRLREDHDRKIADIKEDHARTIERIARDHQQMMTDVTNRHSEERRQFEASQTQERERIRQDAERRERQVVDDSTRQMQMVHDSYESRLSEMQRSHDREIKNVKEQRDREITSIRVAEDGKATVNKAAGDVKVNLLEQRVNELMVQLQAAQSECDGLRQQAYKTPQEAIKGAHELAALTGFGRGGEEEMDWKKGAFQVIKGAIDKAPEMLKSMEEARARNQAVLQQQQQQQLRQAQRQMPPQYPGMPQLQSPMQGPVPPSPNWGQPMGRMPPPPGTAGPLPQAMSGPIPEERPRPKVTRIGSPAPPPGIRAPRAQADVAVVPSAPFGFGGGRQPPPIETAGVAATEQATSPQQPSMGAPTSAPVQPQASAVSLPEQSPAVQPPAAQQQQPAASPEQASNVEVTEAVVAEFVNELNVAIGSGLVTPREFAEAFVAKAGIAVTKQLVVNVNPKDFLESIAAHPQGAATAIVTREGREFVKSLWQEASNIVGGR